MLLLKLKTLQKIYTGPNLVAFIKVIDMDKARQDEQRFYENNQAS